MSNITIEAAELAYDARDHESTQARLAGRLKSACCRLCGSPGGMQAVHRDTMDSMPAEALRLLDVLYYRAGNSAYLFYACHHCNGDKVVPDGLSALGLDDILCWINVGRPGSAEPEQVLASIDSRQSAGLEGRDEHN